MIVVRALPRLSGPAALLVILAASVLPARGDTAPAAPKKIVTIEGITEYRLDNGLRILLFPDPSASNVTINLTVLVGSRHEGYGETGMAHLLEHMVFKGTPLHPDIPKALRDHGAAFNGTTWVDRTNYFETMPATDENLEFGIRLEADRLVNSFIRREDLVSEMTVVRNEFEAGENNPDYILSQRMMAVAYEWHNYGKSTIGNRSDIERVPIERLQAFYRKYYQPDNAVLIVAGKFDEAKALGYISKYFGVLKKPNRVLETTYTEEPPQDGERTVVLRRVGKVAIVGVMYHIPAGAHEDFAAVQVLNNVLVSEPSGRLYQALVPTKLASSVSGVAYGWHDPGVIEFGIEVEKNRPIEEVRDKALDLLETLGQQKLTEEEVERAKRQILKQRELLMTRSNRVGIELSDWAAKGDWRLFFLHRDRVAQVTPADVARVAGKYLQRTNRTVGLYIPTDQPQRSPIPPTPDVLALVKDYKGTQEIAQGEAFDPTPANIEKRVQRSTLPGGVKVALLPQKTRGEAVSAVLTLHYGNDQSLKGQTSATQFLGPLMLRGTRKHTRQQLQDELDKLGARLEAGGVIGDLTFTLTAKRRTLPAVLRLLGEVLREPSFPADEFDILRREIRDGLEKSLTEPTALAARALQRTLSPYPPDDVRYVPTIQESIDRLNAVTLEQVRKLHAEQLGGQVGELAIVGDFDADEAVKIVASFLDGWHASVPYRRIERPARTDVPGGRQTILTPDKENAFYIAAHMLAMSDRDPDYPALRIASYLFGEGSLSSRLGNRVRQKEGLSYGVRSGFAADSRDKSARFVMYAITNPVNIDKVDKAMLEELEKLIKEGVGERELAEAQKAFLEQEKVQRGNDAALAADLAEGLYDDRTFAFQAELEAKIAALKPADVNEAVRRHLVPG
ncbi:MAG: insulinase family protein, partial [Gemmataceae bacterium]|nr:insulinase family protein [Gemmataceae bacterium]